MISNRSIVSTEIAGTAIEESLRDGVRGRRRQGGWFFVGFAIATAVTVLVDIPFVGLPLVWGVRRFSPGVKAKQAETQDKR